MQRDSDPILPQVLKVKPGEDMASFDQLPAELREVVREWPVEIACRPVLDGYRNMGLKQTLKVARQSREALIRRMIAETEAVLR